ELAEGHDLGEVDVAVAIQQPGEGGAVPGLAGLDGGVGEELAEGLASAEPAGVGELGEGALEPDQAQPEAQGNPEDGELAVVEEGAREGRVLEDGAPAPAPDDRADAGKLGHGRDSFTNGRH